MSRIKPLLFFSIVVALAVFLVYRKPASALVNVGDRAPEFSIKDEAGQELKLSDLQGNVVFLNFWGTWCEPCRAEMPDMEVMNQHFKDRKFKMIAIATDTRWEDVKKFYAEYNLTFPPYLDPGRSVADRYNVYKFPETYIIDGKGIVLKHYIGRDFWAKPQMLAAVDDMIKKEEIPAISAQ